MSHWQAKMTIRGTDRLWTQYIKLLTQSLCEVNFRCYRGTPGSDVSHFYGRRKETVRFERDNCDFVCRSCHAFIHTELGAKVYKDWKLRQLGQQRFNTLLLQANQVGKRDDFLTKLVIQQLLKDAKSTRSNR